jgi:hypothetical protein
MGDDGPRSGRRESERRRVPEARLSDQNNQILANVDATLSVPATKVNVFEIELGVKAVFCR